MFLYVNQHQGWERFGNSQNTSSPISYVVHMLIGLQKSQEIPDATRHRYSPTRMSSIWMNLAFSLIKAASYDVKTGFQNGSVCIPLSLDKHCRRLQQTLIARDSTKRQSRNTNLINLGLSDWNFSICISSMLTQFSLVSIPFACKKTCFHHTLWRVWRKRVRLVDPVNKLVILLHPGWFLRIERLEGFKMSICFTQLAPREVAL